MPEVPTILLELRDALPQLRELRIPSGLLHRDEQAAELARLPALRTLRVDGGFPQWHILTGGRTQIGGLTEAGLRQLPDSLRSLVLCGQAVGEDVCREILKLLPECRIQRFSALPQ